MHLNVLALDLRRVGRKVGQQVLLFKTVVFVQTFYRGAAEVDLGFVGCCEIRPVPLGTGGVANRIAVFGFVFAINHKGDVVQQGHPWSQRFLPEHKSLKRMKQVVHCQPREQAVHAAIGRHEVVVKARMQPGLKVFKTPLGVNVGRPGDRERMHVKTRLEHMRSVKTVLTTGARQQAVVARCTAKFVAQHGELVFAVFPVNRGAFLANASRACTVLLFGEAAGITDTLGVKRNRGFFAGLGVLVFDRRVGPLVGNHALFAELHMTRQPIHHAGIVVAGFKG